MSKISLFAVALTLCLGCVAGVAQTNFGPVKLGGSATATVTVTIPATMTVSSIKALTMGATGLDFGSAGSGTCTVGLTYAAGQTCTVGVVFRPVIAGVRKGAVTLSNSGSSINATTYVYGTGDGPQLAFYPGVTTGTTPVLNGVGLEYPQSIAVDGTGTEFIYDLYLLHIGLIKALPGNSTASSILPNDHDPSADYNDYLTYQDGVGIDGAGNRILIGKGSEGAGLLELLSPGSNVPTKFRPALNAGSIIYSAVDVDGAGDVFVVENYAEPDVAEYPSSPSNAQPIIFPSPLVDGSYLEDPNGLAVDPAGNIFIADSGNARIVEIPADRSAAVAIQPIVDGTPAYASGVAVDGVGNLFIADATGHRIVVVPVGGGTSFAFHPLVNGTDPISPGALTFDQAGSLYATDFANPVGPGSGRIVKIQPSQPAPLSFATTQVGTTSADSPKTITVQNVGNEPLGIEYVEFARDYPQSPSGKNECVASSSLSPGQVCNLDISFLPLSTGYLPELVQIFAPSTLRQSASINVSGTGTYVVLSARSLSFGAQQEGTASASQQVTLTNAGSSALPIYGIKVTGTNATSFVFGSDCLASLPAKQSCTIHGHFAPTATGALSATVTIADNQEDTPQTIALTGVGNAPAMASLSATILSFGTEAVGGTSGSQQLTLTNSGSSPLSIAGIRVVGPNASSFVIGSDCPSSLPAGYSCRIHGHFSPTTTGSLSASINITDGAAGSPQMVMLSGTGK